MGECCLEVSPFIGIFFEQHSEQLIELWRIVLLGDGQVVLDPPEIQLTRFIRVVESMVVKEQHFHQDHTDAEYVRLE